MLERPDYRRPSYLKQSRDSRKKEYGSSLLLMVKRRSNQEIVESTNPKPASSLSLPGSNQEIVERGINVSELEALRKDERSNQEIVESSKARRRRKRRSSRKQSRDSRKSKPELGTR